MKLKDCLEIGYNCGLETVSEAVYNVELHRGNIFSYDKMNEELHELYLDIYTSHQKAIEYCEKLIEKMDDNGEIDDIDICNIINILKGREFDLLILKEC